MSIGVWVYYGCCALVGCLIAYFTSANRRAAFKWWVVRVTTPWHEEAASLDLAWRVFARKHNTAGKRPICSYDGWEADLDPDEKADVYEFPNGDPDALPNCLIEAEIAARKQKVLMHRKTAGLEVD